MPGRENVRLLTRGVTLPMEPLPPFQLRVIVDAICDAWRTIIADPSTGAGTEGETSVNDTLVSHLTIALRAPTAFRSVVSRVCRGTEQHNYDGSAIEKRPDINFYLTDRAAEFPFVGECKIIDRTTGRTVALYGSRGIDRFVIGDYAWTGRQALMIAYVRDGTSAEPALLTLSAQPEQWPSRTAAHLRTIHDRHFNYIDRDPTEGVPGPIGLIHIWLN